MSSSRSQRQRTPGLDGLRVLPMSERCEVIRVDTHARTCTVTTSSGSLITGLPWPGDAYDVRVPRPGQSFVLEHSHQSRGHLRALPPEIAVARAQTPLSHIPGSGSPSTDLSETRTRSYSLTGPTDVMPGDRLWRGESGEHMGLLSGGVLSLRASEFANVTVSRPTASVRIAANTFKVHAGAGSMELFADVEGRTGYKLDIGSNAEYESDPGSEKFRYMQRVMADGYVLSTRVTSPSGEDRYHSEVDLDGSLFVEAEYARLETRGSAELFAQTASIDVKTLNARVERAASAEVAGRTTLGLLGGLSISAPAGDIQLQSSGVMGLTSTSGVRFKARGGLLPVPTNKAFEVVAVDGGVSFRIGSLSDGDRGAANSGFDLSTLTGDITFASKSGKFLINTALPGSVKLGGLGSVGIYGVMLYEAFEAWMQLFGTLLDTHTHNAAGVPTTPPLVPIWASSSATLRTIRSNYVSTGG
jgi:hypothetical protein